MKILLVEDHSELAKSIMSYFAQEHYICEVAASFDRAREKLKLFRYDVVLLDIMLPDGNGLDLLKLLRKNKIKSRDWLLLSASGSCTGTASATTTPRAGTRCAWSLGPRATQTRAA